MTPTLLGIVPYAGISFATFETLKSRYNAARRAEAEARGEPFDPDAAAKDVPVVARLCFGGVAGLWWSLRNKISSAEVKNSFAGVQSCLGGVTRSRFESAPNVTNALVHSTQRISIRVTS